MKNAIEKLENNDAKEEHDDDDDDKNNKKQKKLKPVLCMSGTLFVESLCNAAMYGNMFEIDRLLTAGVSINGNQKLNYIPLAVSVFYETSQPFFYLLNKGASVFVTKHGYKVTEEIGLGASWPQADKIHALEQISKRGLELPPILWAAVKGDKETIMKEIKNGCLLQLDGKQTNIAAYLCASGHIELVCEIQKIDPSLLTKNNSDQSTPLLFAAESNQLKVVQYLLKEGGASILEQNSFGYTALFTAVAKGHMQLVKWLLVPKEEGGGGASVTEKNNDGASVLLVAAYSGRLDLVKWLLSEEGGANINETNTIGATALLYAAINNSLHVVKWLLKEGGASIKERDQNGLDATCYAVQFGRLPTLKWLLSEEGGAVISPLLIHLTAECGQTECLQWLIQERDVKVSFVDETHQTLLMHAATTGQLSTVQWLIQAGAKVLDQSKSGMTALLYAGAGGQLPTIQWLLREGGSSIAECDNNGNSILVYAIVNGHHDVVKWLLGAGGAQISQTNTNGSSALLWAAEQKSLPILQWLIEEGGAQISEKNSYGNTALLCAATAGRVANVEWLLKKGGASLEERNNQGHTALNIACSRGFARLLTSLLNSVPNLTTLETLRLSRHAINACVALVNNFRLLQAVCIEYHLKQRLSVSAHLVGEVLHKYQFPLVLVKVVCQYEEKDEEELEQLHQHIVSKYTDLERPISDQTEASIQNCYFDTPWDVSRGLIENLLETIFVQSPYSIATLHAIIREHMICSVNAKSTLAFCLTDILAEISGHL